MPPHTTSVSVLSLYLGAFLLAGSPAVPKMSPGLERLVHKGLTHYQRQEYELACKAYAQATEYAEREGNVKSALRLRNNLGVILLTAQQYQAALQSFLRVREMARVQKEPELEAVACTNLSAIHMVMGDGDAAEEALTAAVALSAAASPHRARLMAQRARMEFRKGGGAAAEALMGEALTAAQSADDRAVEGLIWDDLAMLRMGAGDMDGAETALANEYRLWALFHTPNPEYLHRRVARLRMLQGRAAESLVWLQRTGFYARRSPAFSPSLATCNRACWRMRHIESSPPGLRPRPSGWVSSDSPRRVGTWCVVSTWR